MSRIRVVIPIAVASLVLAGCAPGAAPGPSTWPSSIVVLGHSGATGWNSDSDRPMLDALENSWATGDNPEVDSIYLRFLAENPDLEGHNFNVARSGSDVSELPGQVDRALEQDPLPDLFIIQTVDNDIQCDGTDEENAPAYGDKMDAVLASINKGAPDARVVVVGQWATEENYRDVTGTIQEMVAQNQGGGICDPFDASGQQIPEVMSAIQAIADSYGNELRESCAAAHNCTFAGDEVRNLVIDLSDLASDYSHMSVTGLHKMAETLWEVFDRLS